MRRHLGTHKPPLVQIAVPIAVPIAEEAEVVEVDDSDVGFGNEVEEDLAEAVHQVVEISGL